MSSDGEIERDDVATRAELDDEDRDMFDAVLQEVCGSRLAVFALEGTTVLACDPTKAPPAYNGDCTPQEWMEKHTRDAKGLQNKEASELQVILHTLAADHAEQTRKLEYYTRIAQRKRHSAP
jgi:hypothetical protein